MSYSGMVEQEITQFNESSNNELEFVYLAEETIGKNGDLYERIEEFMKNNISLPSAAVKVNCFWYIVGMDRKEECKGIDKKGVLDEIIKRDISVKTQKILRIMASLLSEACIDSGMEDMTEDRVYICLTEELDPHMNKTFVKRIALATDLSYSTYQNTLQNMTDCEDEDLYELDDFLVALVIKSQTMMRYRTYLALKKDYKMRKDAEKNRVDSFMDIVPMISTIEPIKSIYRDFDFSSEQNIEPSVIEKIIAYNMILNNSKRNSVQVKDELISDITQLLQTSDHVMAKQARSLANRRTMITGEFRLEFNPDVFTSLPEGYEFNVEKENGERYSFKTTKRLLITVQQKRNRAVDVEVQGYVYDFSDQIVFAPKKSLLFLPPYPKGVETICNPFDLRFDSLQIRAFYDPDEFKGSKNVKANVIVGKNRVDIEIPAIEVPAEYSALVPVVGRKNKNGNDAIEVFQRKEFENRWSTTELDDAYIDVEESIVKHAGSALVEGLLRVVLPEPMTIYRDTRFEYAKMDISYDYYAKETVTTGVINTYAKSISPTIEEKAKIEQDVLGLDKVKGLVNAVATRCFYDPDTLFNCFREISLGIMGDEFVDDKRYMAFPLIGEWLKKSWIQADIESSYKVTRNDILTLVFFKYALESNDNECLGTREFQCLANEYLRRCQMNELFLNNIYDMYLSLMAMHKDTDDILVAYSVINRIALRQGKKR